MKKTLLVLLALCIASFAFAANVDKAAVKDALEAYEAGIKLTKAQDATLSEFYGIGSGSGNVIDNAGGPDAFGYTWHDSEEPDGPTFNWYDITGSGTSFIADMGDDVTSGPYPIGFGFPFYGSTQSEVYINSNGCLNFDNAYMSFVNGPLPGPHGAQIAIFSDDLMPTIELADAYYETFHDGTQNVFVISCISWYEYPAPNLAITMQYHLYADGTIQFHYQTVDVGFDLVNSTIGIQDPTRTIGLMALFDGSIVDYPYDGLAIEFSTDAVADASLTGTVTDFDTGLPIEGADVNVSGTVVTTGIDGVYNVTDMYPITVSVSATAAGYFSFGPVNVDLVSGVNTLDIEMAGTPTQTFFTDFEAGPDPFATEGVAWEFGTPTVEPVGAFSGVNAWSVYLDGDYQNFENEWLISTPITVESPAAFMTYQHWYNYESGYDGYNVNISVDGGATWTMLTPEGGYPDLTVAGLDGGPGFTGAFDAWEEVTVVLGTYAGQDVIVAFRHGTDSSVNTYSGVTIDDFALYGTGGGVEPDPVTLTLTPTTAVVPPTGGDVVYDAQLVSLIGMTYPGLRYQTFATLPNSNVVGPIDNLPFNLTPFMDVTVVGLTITVPAGAPAGVYTLEGIAGVPGNPANQVNDSFTFEKIGAAGTYNEGDWAGNGSFITADDAEVVAIPTDFAMNKAYPNPFNPSTSVMIALPQASDLTVSVFNVMGQQVATLANGKFNAGQHNFSFDAANMASGLYFIQAVSGSGELNAIQKITLMK
jgi:Immune inhibitor A-like, MAM domain/Secretion system C-terminal sorting domain